MDNLIYFLSVIIGHPVMNIDFFFYLNRTMKLFWRDVTSVRIFYKPRLYNARTLYCRESVYFIAYAIFPNSNNGDTLKQLPKVR